MTTKVIHQFEVAHVGWECDNTAWVMEDETGKRWVETTNHGTRCKMSEDDIRELLDLYANLIFNTQKALTLISE